jgi:DNA repair exonuclease SbcCD ATPase subunit
VVELIGDLQKQVEKDGAEEQASFDTYACWCEKTLARKASDISAAKELITETDILIKKLEGEIASHGAEIAQLNKDIAANLESQKEATAMREKEHENYASERTESEQCIGALEAAITVLTGSGTKKGFLDTSSHAAQLMSVAASVRSVFRNKNVLHSISEKDLDLVRTFVDKPEDFMAHHPVSLSATQVGHNPFGDYAPQSTQIQGILKGMYDSFSADLEKDNAAEASSEKSFQELMATKKQEQETLELTLQKQEADQAAKTLKLKDSQVLKDDTQEQLQADEAFFAETKEACQSKASEWSIRTRLRTEELQGMQKAIEILSSEEAKKSFDSSATTFLQMASINKHHADGSKAIKAFGQLKKIATEYKSIKVAKIAAAVQLGGHFDKVIAMIDEMITLLRKEEAQDIVHRDLCQNSQNANENEIDDLGHSIKKTEELLKRLENENTELGNEISALAEDIDKTKTEKTELLQMRNKESGEFKQSVKDDTDAVALIRQAIVSLSKFYKDNKIAVELAQKSKSPEYTEDPDKAPETSWSGSDYKGRRGETGGILAILGMLEEDLQKEIKDAQKDDAEAQAQYEEQESALQGTLDAQEATKVGLEEQKAQVEMKITAAEKFKNGKENDQGAEEDTQKALYTDCAWVKTHFETRREKRKNEIAGLVDAKGFLAGVESGDDPLPLGF